MNDKNTNSQRTDQYHDEIQIQNFRPFEKNTLKGFLTVVLPSGMILHDIAVHEKDGARWIGLPSKKFLGKEGEGYTPIVEFTTRGALDLFRDDVLDALDSFKSTKAPATSRTPAASRDEGGPPPWLK